MCGISGGITRSVLSTIEVAKIRELWFLNSTRGVDGSGMFDHKPNAKDAKTHYFKSTKPSFVSAYEKFYDFGVDKDGMWVKDRPNLIVTHARAATRGEKTEQNAHPFMSSTGMIIGVHNGTITGDFPHSKDFETDSQALIETIAEEGVEEAIKKFAKDATSFAAAIAVLDQEKQEFYLYRNAQRPLHLFYQSTTLYFSSAERDLRYAVDQHTVPIRHILTTEDGKTKFDSSNILSLPSNHLLTFKVGEDVSSCTVTEIKPPPAVSYSYHGLGGGSYNQNFHKTHYRGTNRSTPTGTGRDTEYTQTIQKYLLTVGENALLSLGSLLPPKNQVCFFAPEFDRYYSSYYFTGVLLWRIRNHTRYVEMLTEMWNLCKTETDRKQFLEDSGLSKNVLKKLLKGGGQRYLRSCIGTVILRDETSVERNGFYQGVVKGEQVFKNVSTYIRDNYDTLFMPKKKEEEEKSNVILLHGPNKIKYGHNVQYETDSFETLSSIYDKGCAYCTEQPQQKENLFFLNTTQFFCECCQKRTLEVDKNKGPSGLSKEKLTELREYTKKWDEDDYYFFDTMRTANRISFN